MIKFATIVLLLAAIFLVSQATVINIWKHRYPFYGGYGYGYGYPFYGGYGGYGGINLGYGYGRK